MTQKNMDTAGKRLDWLDVAKGIAIFLVVIGHSFRDGMLVENHWCFWIKKIIYVYHIPLFFLLAGFTFRISCQRYNLKELIRRKIKKLLIPFLAYSALLYLIFATTFLFPPVRTILENAGFHSMGILKYISMNLLNQNPYSVHLWFIWVLFWMEVLASVSEHIWEGNIYALLIGAFGAKLLCSNIAIPYMAVMLFTQNVFFFVAGELLYMFQKNIKKINAGVAIVSLAAMLIYVFNEAIMDQARTSNILLYNVSDILLMLLKIPVLIGVIRLSMAWKNSGILSCMGRKSFVIYLFHQPFFAGFAGVLLYNIVGLPILLVCVVCVIASIVCPLLVEWAAVRIPGIRRVAQVCFGLRK